jgi:hypothetical protein
MYGATLGIDYRALVQQLCPRLLSQAQDAKDAAFGARRYWGSRRLGRFVRCYWDEPKPG